MNVPILFTPSASPLILVFVLCWDHCLLIHLCLSLVSHFPKYISPKCFTFCLDPILLRWPCLWENTILFYVNCTCLLCTSNFLYFHPSSLCHKYQVKLFEIEKNFSKNWSISAISYGSTLKEVQLLWSLHFSPWYHFLFQHFHLDPILSFETTPDHFLLFKLFLSTVSLPWSTKISHLSNEKKCFL